VSEVFLRAKQLRQRYHCSYFWIDYRLQHDPSFPKPTYFGRFRHWRLSDLENWENAQPQKQAQ
jgi:predicted DNA-binding transcriptional regulator AlpA